MFLKTTDSHDFLPVGGGQVALQVRPRLCTLTRGSLFALTLRALH
jgi:hypothetical protein